MPKPSPKRTNWKRVADQLAGDVNAVAQDYNDAITKLKAAERRIAELEAEQKAEEHPWAGCNPNIPRNCKACGNFLFLENLYVDDGCPCDSPRGVNFKPQSCDICKLDCCVKPGHRLYELFGIAEANWRVDRAWVNYSGQLPPIERPFQGQTPRPTLWQRFKAWRQGRIES